jgi:hypothetical protein
VKLIRPPDVLAYGTAGNITRARPRAGVITFAPNGIAYPDTMDRGGSMRKVEVALFVLAAGGLTAAAPAVAAPKKAAPTKKTINVKMSGKVEVPKGSPTGSGTAKITLDAKKGQVCYTLNWSKIKTPTAAHIHQGKKGTAGAIVIPLFMGSPKHTACVSAKKSLVSAIIKKPSGYYVNVHTKDFPAGAIRAQL